jgi:hypothetical protein
MTNGSEAEVTTCWIWRGTGDGTISSEEITSFNEQRSFGADALLARTAADLDDDGRFDLVLITPRLVTILLNKTEVAPR